MKYWFYRLEGCAGRSLRSDADPVVQAYMNKHGDKQTLYAPAVGWAPTKEAEWQSIRDYSPVRYMVASIANRLLTVRTEWSKK